MKQIENRIDRAYKEYLLTKDSKKLRDTLDNILVSLTANYTDRSRIVVKILNIYSQFEGGYI